MKRSGMTNIVHETTDMAGEGLNVVFQAGEGWMRMLFSKIWPHLLTLMGLMLGVVAVYFLLKWGCFTASQATEACVWKQMRKTPPKRVEGGKRVERIIMRTDHHHTSSPCRKLHSSSCPED